MTTSYRRLVLHPFVVLLMLVAMVFVAAADAAACGAEVAPGHRPFWLRSTARPRHPQLRAVPGDSDAPTEQHGILGGHCHHGAALPAPCRRIRSLIWLWFPMPPSEALASDIPTD